MNLITSNTHFTISHFALYATRLGGFHTWLGIQGKDLFGALYSYFQSRQEVRVPHKSASIEELQADRPDNEGLVVFIHGLNSHPNPENNPYLRRIEAEAPGKYLIFLPNVPQKGNCSLEEAAEPIFRDVQNYIQNNPGKPVQLIGHSNGGRIAAYIETKLRNQEVNLRMTGIAGVFLGSDLASFGVATGLAGNLIDKKLASEISTNSPTCLRLLELMRQPVVSGTRTYTFYATVDDVAIPNFTSCFPNIEQNEELRLVSGVGHNDIKSFVASEETKKVLDFMEKYRLREESVFSQRSSDFEALSMQAAISI